MCLLQGCTPLRDDQSLATACSWNIFHHSNNNWTSSVTEAIFRLGETLFLFCYPKITKNLKPIIVSHSFSMGERREQDTRAQGLHSSLLTIPTSSKGRFSLSPWRTRFWSAKWREKLLPTCWSLEPVPKKVTLSRRWPQPGFSPSHLFPTWGTAADTETSSSALQLRSQAESSGSESQRWRKPSRQRSYGTSSSTADAVH